MDSAFEADDRGSSNSEINRYRFRYKASKAKQAQSRIKALERLEIVSPVQQKNAFVFEFETPDHSPQRANALDAS